MTASYTRAHCRSGLRAVIVVLVTTIAAACASSKAATAVHRTDCGLTARDSVFALGGPVYRDCGVDRIAHQINNIHADYRQLTPSRTTCYSADLEFVVDTVGKVEIRTARVVRATDSKYAELVVASLPEWKYDPASRDGKLVRQIVASHQSMSATIQRVVVAPGGGAASPPTRAAQRPPTC